MIVLALLLSAIGVADVAGSLVASSPRARQPVAFGTGILVVALGTWGSGIAPGWAVPLIALLALWILAVSSYPRSYPWSIVGLAAVVVAAIVLSPQLPVAQGWLTDWYSTLTLSGLAGASFTTFALAVGAVLFLVESANLLVRMVLVSSLPPGAKPEAQLKGGRILGPIERVFIFAMALTGQFLAISAIVAAKSILRFPEVSNDERSNGGGSAAEYVLVGSFVSWGIALLLYALVANS